MNKMYKCVTNWPYLCLFILIYAYIYIINQSKTQAKVLAIILINSLLKAYTINMVYKYGLYRQNYICFNFTCLCPVASTNKWFLFLNYVIT